MYEIINRQWPAKDEIPRCEFCARRKKVTKAQVILKTPAKEFHLCVSCSIRHRGEIDKYSKQFEYLHREKAIEPGIKEAHIRSL